MLAAGSINCGSSWQVMRQANPNPFRNGATFSLLALDTSTMNIDGQPAGSWLQQHPGEDAATVPNDISGAAPHFGEHAMAHSQGSLSP
ncbi:MAG: hypothetical protein KA978_25875, partial [Deltaproteobacteria bacterium]|nr:hypothetical protein [Deltaproteobacteria bacterium]